MSHPQTSMLPSSRHLPVTALILASCAMAIAACGSSGKPTSAASTSYAAALKYTVCLRSHGVPNVPDPSPEGGIAPITAGSGINPQAPAFRSAQQACTKLDPIAGISPPSYTASQKRAALDYAECLRHHGVPGYPDPIYGRYGAASRPIAKPLPNYINPESPAFIAAEKACQGP
jgi:hypothetical protein